MGRVDATTAASLALLRLTHGASATDVAAAYRRLARKTHPDRSAEPDAAERFAALNAAYRRAMCVAAHESSTAADPAPAPPVTTPPVTGPPVSRPPQRRYPVQFAAGPVYFTPAPRAPTTGSNRSE